jgi:translation initiation factor IF-2
MNISTLAKLLGVSINELREKGTKNSIYGFYGRNTRIPYNSALEITKLLRPEKLSKIKNDDRIYLPAQVTVSEFCETINRPMSSVLKTLMLNGVIATMNEKIDFDTASLIASELNVEVFPEDNEDFEQANSSTNSNGVEQLIKVVEYDTNQADKVYVKRPPVVTVMGHVDHGKTTLLDTIRSTNIVAGEAGAITQHISSYQIQYKPKDDTKMDLVRGDKGYKITFIDTPGHAAFTAMRARGSQLADFIILMVSAVEGPKPQTVEVIERAKISKTPLIVAMNKIDLPDSDLERVKTEISKYGIVPEEWGGDTPFIPISAKTGENVDKLLDTILLFSEINELKGEINCQGQAVVIESHLDTQLGVVTTALVMKDKIKVGDTIRSGEVVTKIRKLENTEGKSLMEAEVGMPVVMMGLPGVVSIGEPIIAYPSVKAATNDANLEKLSNNQNKRIVNVSNPIATGENTINLILKADVLGSLEALKEAIIKFEGVGAVNDHDLDFAQTTNSTIVVFHTDIPSKLEMELKNKKINYIQSDIIYQLLEWVEEQILANTKHETKEVKLGEAKILKLFKSDKPSIQVFGGQCTSGKLFDNKEFKIVRNGEVLSKFELLELQRNRVKASEIIDPQEFGMSIKSKHKIAVGDTLVCFDEVLVK